MPPEEKPLGKHNISSKPPIIQQASGVNAKYNPLPWSDFFDSTEMLEQVPVYYAGSKGHVFICLHGAGHSAQSFAAFAKIMKATSTVVSFDFRGHGTHFRDDETVMS